MLLTKKWVNRKFSSFRLLIGVAYGEQDDIFYRTLEDY